MAGPVQSSPRFELKSMYGTRDGTPSWRYQGHEGGRMEVQMLPEAAAQEESLIKSLRIASDERYRRMEDYKGKSRDKNHFERLMARQTLGDMPSRSVTPGVGADADEAAPQELPKLRKATEAGSHERVRIPPLDIGQRQEWQDTFDRSVRRLFVDFQLSDVPSCRLNHLDRMHSWFEEHGAKATQKVVEGPSYLKADRNSALPPGSTRNIPVKQVDRPLVTGFTGRYPPRSGTATSSAAGARLRHTLSSRPMTSR